ncbi:5-methylthioadenosine/S-adenosylhomocysteine deaminase [Thermoflavimicrobium dichotomicum]|uniref:5-methylthioadenosine/S-adenosylhomocysteine deaminase n=2 Tax=Thermoflavimicrobium dichotomicum TaxID=46223 RepID=A0A1I3TET5_9BACL|nr:amidohydrolase [Thermoflavimicrobium dichotomicum]SFJ69130.1 5-methylthioadenosine/S-adenosylhomocysteine deaminase [Thermoflavimicrobium dichotomicum]
MKQIFIHATIITMVEGQQPFSGALGIENDRITYVGPVPTAKELDAYDQVIDCQGKAILPGFVNTHGHAAMSLLRGYADDLPLKKWLEEKIWPLEAKFTSEQVRAGTALSVLEMIQSGTTCFLDMYDHMDQVGQVVTEAGIRARLCRGAIGFGSEELRQSKLNEAAQFAKDWHGAADGRITTMMAPHSPYTCSPEYIRQFIEKAAELGLPIHTHMSETAAEVQQNVDEYGVRPVEHLRRLGFFDLPSLVAHAVHLTDEEIDILAEYDVKVAHNPGSNLKLGSGIAPIPKMLKKGLRPALATDGAASNNNLDMLEEIQLAALIHKGVNQDPEAVPAYVALSMGTLYGAEALFLDKEIGSLEVGKKADFITIDLSGAHMCPLHDVVSHLVYSASRGDIQDVYVDGKAIMRNRECLTLDEEKIRYDAIKAFEAIQ